MKVEMRFLPSCGRMNFKDPGNASETMAVLSLANDQVSGLLNVLSQILSCERYALPERILRMVREVGTTAG